MTVPAKDEEAERLEGIKRQLDEEREKFTQAAIQLGRQKAALEVRGPVLAIVIHSHANRCRPSESNCLTKNGHGRSR